MVSALVRIFHPSERITREPIQSDALEAAITEAVKKSGPSCEPFVGIIVERVFRRSCVEANWAVKGIKFGRSDRKQCNSALSVIVERLKREFEVAD